MACLLCFASGGNRLYAIGRQEQDAIAKILIARNCPLRVDDHKHQQREHEYDRENNGDAIEVLLDDIGSCLGGIKRAGNHVGNARAFAGMQQYEHDESDAGNGPDDED